MKNLLLLAVSLLLAACTNISPLERAKHMDELAAAGHWQKLRLPAGDFVLTAYVPSQAVTAKVLTVYFEGDGFAWLTPSTPSDDPTPRTPVGLELALHHPQAAAYLARPCQRVAASDWGRCQEDYWTNSRYAPEVIAASDQAVSALKARFGAGKLMLVGYSGGAAVAALVAARRDDVIRFVSVAGNLDIRAWTTMHHIPPLTGSLNPADEWARLQQIPQLHFVGGKDEVITREVVGAYIDRFPPGRRPPLRVLPDFDHSCCWAEDWPNLVHEAFP
ncbi:MAG: alpha/beta hydrolase [Rhodocyclaceae bacterium]|nr:MAG: alpha/beta hydrolase [Rhodocyclaceae bacterium]